MAKLARKLSLLAVVAGALCGVIGGGINILIVDIQNEVPGIGSLVPVSVLLAGCVAIFVALVYAIMSSAMPRAGGGYIYVSRGLSPFWGFILAFVKWCSIIISIGVVAYMDVMILADSMHFLGFAAAEQFLRSTIGSILIPILLIWFFFAIHIHGVEKYGKTVIILMLLMFIGGGIIIGTNLTHTQEDFLRITNASLPPAEQGSLFQVIYAAAILFWAYIGFTGVSQAGGEIKNPKENLPKAFIITSILIMVYYFVYSYAFYHAVPWQYILGKNLTVPGLTGLFLPNALSFIISILIFITLANDIPPALLTSSRLFYSWAQDKIIPKKFAKTSKRKVPHFALLFVSLVSSLIVIECAIEGFFLAVNIIVISRFLVYILIALSVIEIKRRNKALYKEISFIKNRKMQVIISIITLSFMIFFFSVLVYTDLTAPVEWYEHITIQLLLFIVIAVLIYSHFVSRMKRKNIDYKAIMKRLPNE